MYIPFYISLMHYIRYKLLMSKPTHLRRTFLKFHCLSSSFYFCETRHICWNYFNILNIICNNILFYILLLHHLFVNFVDINECTKSPSVCHQNANCTNTDRSYACRCLTGYSGDGNVDCTGTVFLQNYFIVVVSIVDI